MSNLSITDEATRMQAVMGTMHSLRGVFQCLVNYRDSDHEGTIHDKLGMNDDSGQDQ